MQLKYFVLLILFTTTCLSSFSKNKEKAKTNDEIYRAQVHFSAKQNRMGSPISMLQIGDENVLYYQYNPYNFTEGFYQWGSATTTDGLSWTYKNLVLKQAETSVDSMETSPWWGTSFMNDGKINLIYNRWNQGVFTSEIDLQDTVFTESLLSDSPKMLQSEPFVFKYEPSNRWVMILYNRTDSTINIFNSEDKKTWTFKSAFQHDYGFPSMYELKVDRKPDAKKWVLITENATYKIGDFDGSIFKSDGIQRKFDFGKTLGGSVCVPNDSGNELIVYTEMKHDQDKELSNSGMLTFPSTLQLRENEAGIQLYKQPIDAISTLFDKEVIWENKKIYPGIKNNILGKLRGDCYYFEGEIDLATTNIFGFGIRGKREKMGTEISYVVEKGVFSALGTGLNYVPDNGKFEFKFIIDRSSIEIFMDEGRYCISSTFLPKEDEKMYNLTTRGGEIIVDQLKVYSLKSIWEME